MFCPLGHLTLHEVSSAFWSLAGEWWSNKGRELQIAEWDTHLDRAEGASIKIETGQDELTALLAYKTWATLEFVDMQMSNLIASSPQGQLMRLGTYVFEGTRLYSGEFPEKLQGQRELIENAKVGLFHLEPNYFLVRPCSNEYYIEAFDLQTEVATLREFEGWAICWEPPGPDWREQLASIAWLDRPQEEKSFGQRKQSGRPRIQEVLLRHYVKLFPRGHAGFTAKDVLRRISDDGGPMASDETLRRAIASIRPQNT